MMKVWIVDFAPKVRKALDGRQKKKALPQYVVDCLKALAMDIECFGPNLGQRAQSWSHFSSLGKDCYHCHLLKSGSRANIKWDKKGSGTTYVACWKVEDKKVKFVEVYYVVTHENAPY